MPFSQDGLPSALPSAQSSEDDDNGSPRGLPSRTGSAKFRKNSLDIITATRLTRAGKPVAPPGLAPPPGLGGGGAPSPPPGLAPPPGLGLELVQLQESRGSSDYDGSDSQAESSSDEPEPSPSPMKQKWGQFTSNAGPIPQPSGARDGFFLTDCVCLQRQQA